MNFSLSKLGALLLAGAVFAKPASACGPFFPNYFLDDGDRALLAAPLADHQALLRRLPLPREPFVAVGTTNDLAGRMALTASVEAAELRAALAKAGVGAAESERIVAAQRAEREGIGGPTSPEAVRVVAGLPGEFADYFRGWRAYHLGRTDEARRAWRALLARPAAERPFRSTWAAYMLGRASAQGDPGGAIAAYQQVRALAQAGFADPLGLAASSLGWEAQIHLEARRFEPAIELYLRQWATGDPTALVSLRLTAHAAFEQAGPALPALARNPRCRAVLTAWALDRGWSDEETVREGVRHAWLVAVEAAGARDVDAAEQFALAAYQAGEFGAAQRWIQRAPGGPVAQWLQAKLYFRAGDLARGAECLARAAAAFPAAADAGTNALAGALKMDYEHGGPKEGDARRELRGEMAVLHLPRREYTAAVDTLLRQEYWLDAAYLAERVLTVEECREYVDRNWPAANASGDADAKTTTEKLRHLLGRRLCRLGRGAEAAGYFPPALQETQLRWWAQLQRGRGPANARAVRAADLWAAAQTTRQKGMELLGTETAPDWAAEDGSYQMDVVPAARGTNQNCLILTPTADELRRFQASAPNPDRRFHYRYRAAELAWEAAELMPDNSPETARVLVLAGGWLKDRDAAAADRFYKALARRCPRTALGADAARRHWFPPVDDKGNLEPAPSGRR